MNTCEVESRPDRSVGTHLPCGEPAEFIAKYLETKLYPAHKTLMCSKHAEMASKLVKVDR